MFKLVIQDDEGKTTVVPLIRDEITIGRKEGNTIRLTERNVSRRHARIQRSNGSVAIEDLDSYNGILVNGTRIQGKVDLSEADRVQIGDYLIELKTESAASDDAPATAPMERVDPTASTPVPEVVDEAASDAATRPVATAPTGEHPAPAPPPAVPPPTTVPAVAPPPTPIGTPSLADTDPGLGGQSQSVPRMVALSSNFAGMEFPLDKPACVIGRTDDNDIVVNHRSISRHHAKIVQEQGRFAIVDLQSSNGVRVNGEEYGKVELRRGDVVDLGHVRLRFVEADEDFVLGRDAEIVDLAAEGGGGRRAMLWAVLGVIIIGGGIALFAMRGGDDKKTAAAGGDITDRDTKQPPPELPVVVRADAAPAVEPPPSTGGDVAEHLSVAHQALEVERWADMQAAALEALAVDPSNEEARRLKSQAERELKNELKFGKFQTAASKRDYRGAKRHFESIDRNSVYRLRAQNDYDRLKNDYIDGKTSAASRLASAGKCKELSRLARDAGKLFPEAREAASAFMTQCRNKLAALDKKPDKRPDKKPDKKPPKNGGGSTSGKSANELAEDASAAAKKGNYGRAYKLCDDALELKPSLPKARMVCTIASCKMKNAKRARKHYGRLSDASKRLVKQLCAAAGIDLP